MLSIKHVLWLFMHKLIINNSNKPSELQPSKGCREITVTNFTWKNLLKQLLQLLSLHLAVKANGKSSRFMFTIMFMKNVFHSVEFALRWSVCEKFSLRKEFLMLCRVSVRAPNIKFVLNHTELCECASLLSTHAKVRFPFIIAYRRKKLHFRIMSKKFSTRRILLYDDVAIYSDSMIYSNLRCFYQIKFIFCTMSRVVECIPSSDFVDEPCKALHSPFFFLPHLIATDPFTILW